MAAAANTPTSPPTAQEEVVKAREVRDELRARLEAIRSDRDALQSQFEEIRCVSEPRMDTL
jgi:uncharacterized coiled-coil DUF342 family protein